MCGASVADSGDELRLREAVSGRDAPWRLPSHPLHHVRADRVERPRAGGVATRVTSRCKRDVTLRVALYVTSHCA